MRLKFIFLTLLLISAVYILLNTHKNEHLQKHLDKETIQYSLLYTSLYGEFQDKSKLIFDLIIDQKEVYEIYKGIYDTCKDTCKQKCQVANNEKQLESRKRLYVHFKDSCKQKCQVRNNEKQLQLRKRLYDHFKDIYLALKANHKKPIIHFHTMNNRSFLRMHLLDKFGDDLTDIRPLVAQVNRTKKFAAGFEVGKSFSRYRFIYPIIDETNTHLGSVEIAYDISAFAKEFMENANANANIHVLKKVIDAKFWKDKTKFYYTESPLKGMYTLRKTVKNIEKRNKMKFKKIMTSLEVREKIVEMTHLHKGPFSIYDFKRGDSITVIPITNPATKETVAYLTTKHFSKYLKNEITHFYNNLFMISSFIVIFMFLLYLVLVNQKKHAKILSEKNQELAEKKYELEKLNSNLEDLVEKKTEEVLKQEQLIFKQSKIAALGAMMDAIAHQWKQPLSVISMAMNNFQLDMELDEKISKESATKICSDVNTQINHLTTTINDFREFFRPDKPKELYSLKEVIDSTLKLGKSSLTKSLVEVNINADNNDIKVHCIKTEFMHVLLILINNSIDAFIEQKVEKRVININLFEENNNAVIEVCDNGGGIPENVLPNIFKHNYTTKEEGKGSGVGLYLANQILEKIDGTIEAYNKNEGVCFKITIPNDIS